jgi:glycine oxidase
VTGQEARWDVVVIGGGIMGSTVALFSARRGAKVLVLERNVPGAEASSAAAGILGAQIETHGEDDALELFVSSRSRWEAFAASLVEATGVDVGYRRCGALQLFATAEDAAPRRLELELQTRAGLTVEELDREGVLRVEPAVAPSFAAVFRYPDDAEIDPPRLLRALQIAATLAGVTYRSGVQARAIAKDGDRAAGVTLDDGTVVPADHVVLAAGSWSSLVEGVPLASGAVRPARGQMLELTLRAPAFQHVLFGPGAYLVPRADGRVLVGSTLEFVGFHKDVTARAVRDLLVAATAIVPALEDASLTGSWSNFRPFSATGKPLVGPSPLRRLWLATGHHRNGILLAPITGEIVCAAMEGRPHPLLGT